MRFSRAALVVGVLAACAYAQTESVAARVNGVAITEAQVQDLTQRMSDSQPKGTAGSAPEAARQDALQSLIDIEVLTQAAKAENIEASDAEVNEKLNEIKARYPPDAFQKTLAANRATEADLRRELGRTLQMEKLLDRQVSVKVAPDAAEHFYKENPDKFGQPAAVHASHILFRIAAEGDQAAARKRAEDALQRLRKGEDFATLAKELSEDKGSAEHGGDLGFFPQEAMVKPFADAAFSLKPGEISEVISTEFGFHIIKVIETRPAGVAPLADVKPQIERYLESQEREKAEHAYVEQLKTKQKIEIGEPSNSTPAASAAK